MSVDGARALLETLVDLDTPAQRADMAKRLARRKDVSLTTWLAAAKTFGSFEKRAPGATTRSVSLPVGDSRASVLFTAYVPEAYDPTAPAPLLMAFHGTGGDGRNMWQGWKPAADALGMIVVCPGDSGASGGYTAAQPERDRAWAALRYARRRFNVDENRIFATGVSRGGHLTWDLALRHPDRFAAIAPMIGAPRLSPAGGQNNLRYLENLAHVPIRDLQGLKDDPLMIHNLRYAFGRLKAFKAVDAELVTFPDHGHSFEMNAVDWIAWLKAAARKPVPSRWVRRFAKAGEGRAGCIEVLKAHKRVAEIPQIQVGRSWNRMSKEQQREFMADYIEQRTARLEVLNDGPGELRVNATDVLKARLLLPLEMLDEKMRVEVLWNRRKVKRTITPKALVLLAEFAERFDRTFLPVGEVKLP